MRALGYDCYGVDCSAWAVDNCDPEVSDWVDYGTAPEPSDTYDWVIAKDVLEHVADVTFAVDCIMEVAKVGVFVVVPLAAKDGGKYLVRDYEADITHIHRLTLPTWAAMFMAPEWSVEASYRLPGVKDNYYKPGWEKGNGFITARRIE